jgi:fatty-acid desaturase
MLQNMKEAFLNIFKQSHLWGGLIPLHILGCWSLYTLYLGLAPSWWWIATIIGYIALMTTGISAGFHRMISHNGFETHPIIRKIILYFGVLAIQGSPITWVTLHRGYHHKFSDKEGDPHSPVHGFWHSYMGWMFKTPSANARSAVDLLRDPYCVFLHEHYKKIVWGSYLLLALIDINLMLYLVVLPALITTHSYSIQTSFNHNKNLGYRNYETNDNSVNTPWLFPVILGDCWHNNHHGDPKNPNYGRRWWELDIAYWIVCLIKK